MEAERAVARVSEKAWPENRNRRSYRGRVTTPALAAAAYPAAVAVQPPPAALRRGAYARLWKRLLDIVLSLPFLVLSSPVIVVLAALIVFSSGWPAFHRTRRLGRGGREFTMWKLRTMVPEAERMLAEWFVTAPELAAEYYTDFKIKDDPRVTRLGKFLRRSSLDELPQFWNVLRGDMAMVGPRPIVLDELQNYGASAGDFLSVRPGITGLWQTDGRNEVRYPERSWFELTYRRSFSLPLDLKILARTLASPFRFNG
jgi:lipopolysaccharide/colanic/teichoic acid biosynthesis glycosyltransferase